MREPMSQRKQNLVQLVWDSFCSTDDCVDLSKISNDGFKNAFGQSEGEMKKADFFEFYMDICM
jgi:hypothetical protein